MQVRPSGHTPIYHWLSRDACGRFARSRRLAAVL